MKSLNRILAIDFDQVIHDKLHPVPGRRMGKPFPTAKTSLEHLKHHGDIIIVHTTMANTAGGKKAVADWLNYYEIPYDSIEGKPTADFYIDDKAIKHTDWRTTLDEIRKNTHTAG